MARGNQRDKAREKNLKEKAGEKKKNGLSGSEFQRVKEEQADIMRKKQQAGMSHGLDDAIDLIHLGFDADTDQFLHVALDKKGEKSGGKV